ncbi:hypothetical protein [Legionella sp. 16cNR16C]|uniref:hypothetical protein n=1 Tax=Legionella sp. 16cNR16C TaxID=2905656 RepID=UPI001E378BB4|nr:hypothetical protein [Legionella sp. 16cNR16C]MCE3046207.1 hypothetical protein [Legionella sp. 16cNR16C]
MRNRNVKEIIDEQDNEDTVVLAPENKAQESLHFCDELGQDEEFDVIRSMN